MSNKKILMLVLFITFVFSCVFPFVSAKELELGDFYAKDEAYSFSEDEIYMPFMRFSSSNIIVDRKVNNIGAIFANKTIEINEEVTRPIALFAQDTIRINSNISDAAIFSTTNVIVEKEVNGTLIIFSVGNVTISEDAIVNGDIICFSTGLTIKGNVNGNVIGSVGTFELTGNIEKDLRIDIDSIKVENGDQILGEVYLETAGENINVQKLKELYPNLINKIIEHNDYSVNVKDKIINIVSSIIITSVISWLIYLIFNSISKNKIFEKNLDKALKYKSAVIITGAVSVVAIPLVILLCLILLLLGLEMIAIPVLTLYIALIIIGAVLNIFVIGSLTSVFILRKVDINGKEYLRNLIPLLVFLALSLISKIPFISGVVGIVFVMLAIGIIAVCVVKKD